jgi:hypothetical protein
MTTATTAKSIKLDSNVFSNVLDHSCELNGVFMVEKLWQRHGPVELRISVCSELSA